jgi:hypothetical protein
MRAWAGALCILSAAASVLAAEKPCDRACLKSVLDQYLDAVFKHDPSFAPLFRWTDDARRIGDHS